MRIEIRVGDVLRVPADVLISTANPWLQMTGGVNLKIILSSRGEEVHTELQTYLPTAGRRWVAPGTVVRTRAGSLPFRHILHAVSIQPDYESSVELVAETLANALTQARELGALTVAMPALATGFGPLSMSEFATALRRVVVADWHPVEILTVSILNEDDADAVRLELGLVT